MLLEGSPIKDKVSHCKLSTKCVLFENKNESNCFRRFANYVAQKTAYLGDFVTFTDLCNPQAFHGNVGGSFYARNFEKTQNFMKKV